MTSSTPCAMRSGKPVAAYGTRGGDSRTYGGGAGAQHSQTLYSVLAHIPGLKVVVPSTAYNAKGLTIAAIRDNGPVIVGMPRMSGRALQALLPDIRGLPGPVYSALCDAIVSLVLDGRVAPETRLPSERELAEQFQVSRASDRFTIP